MKIGVIQFMNDRLMALSLAKIPFSHFWEYWGWLVLSILLFLLLALIVILWKKVRSEGRMNEKLNRELSLAVKSGNISVWRYSVERNALYGIRGLMLFEEGESFESFLNKVHPDNQQEYRELFSAMCQGRVKQGEILFRVKIDDDYRYIRNSLIAVRRNNGKVRAIIGTRIDVTEEIARQIEVNEVADRFNTVFNVATVGLEFYDSNGVLIEINAAAMAMLGIQDKTRLLLARKNLYRDSAYRHHYTSSEEDKRKKLSFDLEYDLSRVESDYKQKSLRSGLRQLHIEVHPRFNMDGDLDCTIVLIYDLTEDIIRNHQYERLYWEINSILRALPVGVAIYQKDGTQKYVNDAYVEIFGVHSRVEFLKQQVSLFDNPALIQHRDRWFTLKEDESIEFEASFDFSMPELKEFYHATFTGKKQIAVRARAILNMEGGIESFLVISSDVTAVNNTFEELKKAKEKAEQSDLLKSVFLANMSHEIRTPLNAIVGFSDLAVSSDEKEEREEYGKIITANSQLLLNLINDILDLSKIEAGYLDFVEVEYDLAELFQELALTFEMKMSPEVAFECVNPYLSVIVSLDRKRTMQVMNNFMSNAVKYTPKGKITMGYELQEGGIRLYVRDTGIGISDEKKKFVFKRFEKLDSFAQGTGLGLSICKALVDAKGGDIGFESTFGEGSLFWIFIPTTTVIGGQSEESESEEEINSNIAKKREKMVTNVLVVEDNDSNFILIKAMLRGYTVERAENGQIAVDKAREGGYDLIFMDMRMPVMGGVEATRAIRTFDTHTPIVAVTANVFDSDKEEAFAAGCNAFVAKPVQKDVISKVLRGEYD